MIDVTGDYAAWIGKQEEQHDILTVDKLQRFAATLDYDPAAMQGEEAAPPLAHWMLFLPTARQSQLGDDGHPRRGGFLPPVHHLPRRMWAGGRLTFDRPLPIGIPLTRLSRITSIKNREGSLGPLVFVTVRHEITEQNGSDILLTEEHDIVYRSADGAAAKPAPEAPPGPDWMRMLEPDDTLLFRYSALTFNTHRIHYDRRYVTEVEGYPGLVVHAPLTATLLADLVRRELPAASLETFSFRAVSPLFDGSKMHVCGKAPDKDGIVRLWAANATNGLAMQAEARIA